ncbi:MAG: ABC transporter permease subunit [Eubacterium sp.]|nr:ABC transporter permease subunit [Eubacterium sp.]
MNKQPAKLLAAFFAVLFVAVTVFTCAGINIPAEVYADEGSSGSVSEDTITASDTRGKLISEGAADTDVPAMSYNGKRLGTITGSIYENDTLNHFPESEVLYYSGVPELYTALRTEKIDGFVMSTITMSHLARQHDDITWLPELLSTRYRSFGFTKDQDGESLRDQFDEMLAELKEDGTLEELKEIWYGTDDSLKVIDTSGLTGENGTLNVGINTQDEPYIYVSNTDDKSILGFNIDIVTRFARRYGYKLKYHNTSFSALLIGLSSGKFDMIASSVSYTPERGEMMIFSDSVYELDNVLAVRTEDIDSVVSTGTADDPEYEEKGVFERIIYSFEKNFIREKRWKLILSGIGVTCLITVIAGALGTLIGFLICMLRRLEKRWINRLADIYVSLLRGMPIVVLLMILYYVVFSGATFSSVWVAVIGFSLNFGASVSSIMQSGINSVDKGQKEAALALGYSENKAFFKFVYPQAAMRFLPLYTSELVSLLKGTSIVGYITIQDLTSVSDIIRSRTYEALFPLITNALIYFILAWIITRLLSLLLNHIDPKKKAA